MKEILFYEGLIAVDRLDGKELVDGEKLRVKFADGTIEPHEVIIQSEHFNRDKGGPLELVRRRAFFKIRYKGNSKWITAVGLQAERV